MNMERNVDSTLVMPSQTTTRPYALVIDDVPEQARIAGRRLKLAGFDCTIATSIIEGDLHATRLLSPQNASQSVVIFLDMKMPEPGHPELEASILAADLAHRMEAGALVPALLVAISTDMTEERAGEAKTAGCRFALSKPLQPDQVLELRQALDAPIPLPHADKQPDELMLVRSYQALAVRTLRQVKAAIPFVWTREDAYYLLRAFTSFPVIEGYPSTINQERLTTVLLRLGGEHKAKDVLYSYLRSMEPSTDTSSSPDAPYDTILRMLLQRKHRSAIIAELRARGYAQATSYRKIQEMPEHLCSVLQQQVL